MGVRSFFLIQPNPTQHLMDPTQTMNGLSYSLNGDKFFAQ